MRLHVLGGMHREIDRPGKQRRLDLLREETLASGLGQRAIADRVTGGPDRHDLDRIGAFPCATSASRTAPACQSASRLPRVPMRMVPSTEALNVKEPVRLEGDLFLGAANRNVGRDTPDLPVELRNAAVQLTPVMQNVTGDLSFYVYFHDTAEAR